MTRALTATDSAVMNETKSPINGKSVIRTALKRAKGPDLSESEWREMKTTTHVCETSHNLPHAHDVRTSANSVRGRRVENDWCGGGLPPPAPISKL
jgi:hypothetical protein